MNHILFFGLGFSARALARRLAERGWAVSATSRSASGAEAIEARGYRGLVFDGSTPLPQQAFDGVTHVVNSAPPGDDGDPVLRQHATDFAARAKQLQWVAYLSTTGVYGDCGGAWVDENAPCLTTLGRSQARRASGSATCRRARGL